MASFQGPGYGFSSQLAVNATAKKMAKSKVGRAWRVRETLRRAYSAPPLAPRSAGARFGFSWRLRGAEAPDAQPGS